MDSWTLLLNVTLKSTLVLAVAWLIASGLRRQSAAVRHIVWTTAFAALLAVPLMSIALPSWPHRVANLLLAGDPGLTFKVDSIVAAREAGTAAASAVVKPAAGAPVPAPADPRRVVFILWLAGVAVSAAQMLAAYVALGRLRRRSRPSPYRAEDFVIDQAVALLETPHAMPMTAGILRPTIFLPAESATWTAERSRIVVMHEYAHILRGDAASQLLARIALCLHWFNPLAWIAWRAFLKERERAADDLVLRSGARASDYAGHLLEVARTLRPAPAGVAAIAMARPSQLEGRLLAILDSSVCRKHPGRTALACAVLAALVISVPLATVRAQSQAEQKPEDVQAAIVSATTQKNHEMLEHTAVAYEKLRQFAEAQKLREAALAIRKESSKAAYAQGLVNLGDLARKRGANEEAIRYYQLAVEQGDMPETVPALIALGLEAAFHPQILQAVIIHGLEAVGASTTPAGIDYLERARNAAKDGGQIGRAMTWIAFLQRGNAQKAQEVESLYRTAMSVEGPDTSEQALTTELLAQFLRTQNRESEAQVLEERAKTLRRSLAARLSPMTAVSSTTQPHKVGAGVTAPRLLYKMEPAYSEEARATKYQGTVLLKVVVDVDGMAKDIQVVKGLGLGLDEKAVEAISAWKFKPGEQGGVAVPVMAQIEVNFRLL
jgi:TonB family protein